MADIRSEILKVSKLCPEAGEVLRKIAPHAFKRQYKRGMIGSVAKEVNLSHLSFDSFCGLFPDEQFQMAGLPSGAMAIRTSGELKNKGFYLDDSARDWDLVKDKAGCLCLVPLPKGSKKIKVPKKAKARKAFMPSWITD